MKVYDDQRKNEFGACYALSSRRVLCGVVPQISAMPPAKNLSIWNSSYRSGIVMCRSSLHVLHKIDGKRTPFLAASIERRYQIWKNSDQVEHYFHLINTERNNLLKEGRSSFKIEDRDNFAGEPKLLVGTRFIIGSDLVRSFARWILDEIVAIEEEAFLNSRAARPGIMSTAPT